MLAFLSLFMQRHDELVSKRLMAALEALKGTGYLCKLLVVVLAVLSNYALSTVIFKLTCGAVIAAVEQ